MNKRNLKINKSDPLPAIDWAAVDAAPLADAPDEDSPELTVAQFAELRPLREVLPSLSTGKTLINETLRRALVTDDLKETLREVIREELHSAQP